MLDQLSPISEKRIAIRVTPVAERALRSGHPWLFEGAITKQSVDGRSGDIAIIFDRKKRFLAAGLYDPDSSIRVRVLEHNRPAIIDQSWFQSKIAAAARLRAPLEATKTNGYRLVHGENDGLPGLVIDRYDNSYVMKLYTAVWIPHLPDLIAALQTIAAPYRIVLRLSRDIARQKSRLFGLQDGSVIFGQPLDGPVQFMENGLTFAADLVRGQKTGFFLDQRENRARVEKLAKDKTVLNVFAYTGGFALYAARGGARSVLSLDSSHPALNAAARNFDLNPTLTEGRKAHRHRLLKGDAFDKLAELQKSGNLYDIVIIDPPSFAKSQTGVERALAAYARLVRLGLGVLEPGGTLVMASCSSRIEADEFYSLVHRTAREERRPLREIERAAHPLDHPIGFKEGAYLKCL
ncbi:MAG: class I SAM-dependent rRNA methyltransferase, partial [Chloroflexi bacterium]|nr:class I SAM-dependent rRNA methyltransferase [Chloroflexota bacterium]